ncbi:hypothetical protein ElyMa_005477500 [Elysia marginata]|uniref:Uncharacterized protein n=1 Tax=Elysia marginata TaxID=1093978 RepID=A0AAV4ERQ7_9GAST|nr:hypothetical protein ElyMa_005477500 [Elysia marginata]
MLYQNTAQEEGFFLSPIVLLLCDGAIVPTGPVCSSKKRGDIPFTQQINHFSRSECSSIVHQHLLNGLPFTEHLIEFFANAQYDSFLSALQIANLSGPQSTIVRYGRSL